MSIPLFTLQSETMSVPLTLSYRSNGIRVEDRAGMVGLGWSLSSVGAVHRSLEGRPDEAGSSGYFDASSSGKFLYDYLDALATPPENTLANECSQEVENYIYPERVITGQYDGAPDLFQLSGLLSGSFFAHRDAPPLGSFVPQPLGFLTNPLKAWKINYVPGSFPATLGSDDVVTDGLVGWCASGCGSYKTYNDYIASWGVTDEYGNTYTYSAPGGTQTLVEHNSGGVGGNSDRTTTYVSSWGLTGASSSSGFQEVTATYELNEYTVVARPRKGFFYSLYPSGPNHAPSGYSQTDVTTTHREALVSTIETSTQRATFMYSLRSDVSGAKRLDKIVITDVQTGAVVIEFSFTYTYQNASGGSDSRMMLTEVRERNGAEIGRKWKFTYNAPLPDYDSFAIDHWGYYTGISIPPSAIHAPLPSMTVTSQLLYGDARTCGGGTCATISGISRAPSNASNIARSLLNSVTYPTGAEVFYEYEPNDYQYVSDQVQSAGATQGKGVRVRRTYFENESGSY
ncbi:MAG: hypothetical protein AAFU38_19085, partial [Bacteroidota bacterium]